MKNIKSVVESSRLFIVEVMATDMPGIWIFHDDAKSQEEADKIVAKARTAMSLPFGVISAIRIRLTDTTSNECKQVLYRINIR